MSLDRQQEVAELMRTVRQQAGLSQEALADILGEHQTWVSRRELAKTQFTAPELYRWVEACGLRVDLVMTDLHESCLADLLQAFRDLEPEDQEALVSLASSLGSLDPTNRRRVRMMVEMWEDLPSRHGGRQPNDEKKAG